MSLRERLTEEMKGAMKARDDLRLSTIRLIRSAVKNKEIELKKELDDQGIIDVIASLVKQRRESIRLFKDAGRQDLVEKEEKELSTLLGFLPQQLSREEVSALVARVVAECGAQGGPFTLRKLECSKRARNKTFSPLNTSAWDNGIGPRSYFRWFPGAG